MKHLFLRLTFLGLCLSSTVYGQTNNVAIGTTESNFTNYKLDKHNPYIGIVYFYKKHNNWEVLEDTFVFQKQQFNIYYKGLKIANVSAKMDTTIERTPYFWFPYKFTNKQIPKVGHKSFVFSGMGGEKCYRPLIISNSIYSKQNNIPKYRKPNKNDSLFLIKYLIETAQKLNLGNIDSIKERIIKKVNRVLVISNDCYFIDADINLNMYCYKDKVPFDTDLSYFLSSTQKYSVSESKKTYNSYFLVNKTKVSYIDYDLKYLDSGDYDNDGYDEIIFRMDKYNYTGYLMVTDKWNTFLTNHWSYH